MLTSSDAWRRLFGTLFLGGALVMLVWGQTMLKDSLQGLRYLVYWTICMGLTFLALMVALFDLWIVRSRGRENSRDLAKKALVDMARKLSEGQEDSPSDASMLHEKARRAEDTATGSGANAKS